MQSFAQAQSPARKPVSAFTPGRTARAGGPRQQQTEPPVGIWHDFSRLPVYPAAPALIQRKCRCGGEGSAPCSCGGRGDHAHTPADSPGQGGQPLPAPIRQRLEPLLGVDFSSVRIHDDAASHRAAAGFAARAFTLGQHIHFGSGQYRPAEADGMRLLAHELAHTVQQASGTAAVAQAPIAVAAAQSPLEREADNVAAAVTAGRAASVSLALGTLAAQLDPQPAARIDVSIVLTDEEQDMAEGRSYASTVIRVTSPEDARDKLKALGKPIGTLYVVSHSNAAGNVEFISSIGTISWTPISSLGATLKTGFASGMEPVTVDFRGCKVGSAGSELESFRSGVGAKSAKGSTCWTFTQRVTPLTLDGVDVTSPSQIPKGRQARFDEALLKQIDGLKSDDGTSVKNCLVGLAPNENADRAHLSKIWSLYWANNGNLVATWASPQYNHNWQQGSICTKNMTASTSPCAIVEKTAPAPPSTGGSGSKSGGQQQQPAPGGGGQQQQGQPGGRQSMLEGGGSGEEEFAAIETGEVIHEENA